MLVRHPHVPSAVTDWVPSLRNHLLCYRWSQQVASALKYLHRLEPRVIFRDLSAANVLLTATKAGQADAKLIDFGLAKEATEEQISLQAEGIACTLHPGPWL